MMNNLPFSQDAERLRSDIVPCGTRVPVDCDRWDSSETVVQVRGKSQLSNGLFGTRVVAANALLVVESALEAVRSGQYKSGAEGMRVT